VAGRRSDPQERKLGLDIMTALVASFGRGVPKATNQIVYCNIKLNIIQITQILACDLSS
jgi:hypothetical protein